MSKDQKPIIVKKYYKKAAHGHHGGTWKIAYADFVTAMMAFFMLMWLINSITMEQKKGIADYFTPNITKIREDELPEPIEEGQDKQGTQEVNLPGYTQLIQVKRNIENIMQENPELRSLRSHVHLGISREGLTINLMDNQNRPMFVPGSNEMMEPMKLLLKEIT
ncbi:MAG: flagellar motor protein MotB, partial [Alphaproteobacteria bacterium]|nr:flagellar motor protein MotB [Alphaproteobacteria bacterium]